MKANTLSLSFRQMAATDKSPAHLVAELRVDGERLGEGCVVDIRRLADALTRDGEHFVFTCGCGVPACVGIHEGVRSQIRGDTIAMAGKLPKGRSFSFIVSGSQARKAVADALVAVEALAASLDGEDGYPIGPDMVMDGAVMRRMVEVMGR